MQPFGRYLKTEREKRGIRLEEIASSTKIHIQNLVLMEEDRWKELPQDPFIRGFISAYARYIGLDNKETLKLFSQYQVSPDSIAHQNVEASSSQSSPSSSSDIELPPAEKKLSEELKKVNLSRSYPLRTVLLAALLLLMVVFMIARRGEQEKSSENIISQSSPASEILEATSSTILSAALAPEGTPLSEVLPAASPQPETANLPTTLGSTTAVTATTIPENALQTIPAAPPSRASAPVAPEVVEPTPTTQIPSATSEKTGHELTVQVKYRSWMKIVIDDAPPKESYLREGEKVNFQAKDKIKLVLGNASESVVTHNGEESKGSKYAGTIRYYIFPKGSRFPQDKPKPKETDETSGEGMQPTTSDAEKNSESSTQ